MAARVKRSEIRIQMNEADSAIGCLAAPHASSDPRLVPCRGSRRWTVQIMIDDRRGLISAPPVRKHIASVCDAHSLQATWFLLAEILSTDALRGAVLQVH